MQSSLSNELPPVNTIFIWDFDWTIVNCNSDEYVPTQFLGYDEVFKRVTDEINVHGPNFWHEIIAKIINACHHEKAASMDDVLEKSAAMPYLLDVKQALTDVYNSHNCGQAIISDGNDKFIEAYLRQTNMLDYFTHGIETNIATWDNESLFKIAYQSSKYGGHECSRCPPNLCKSQVLQNILDRMNNTSDALRPRIVYVGDGHNDACPALCVMNDENDILLAREGKRKLNPNSLSGPQSDDDQDCKETADGGDGDGGKGKEKGRIDTKMSSKYLEFRKRFTFFGPQYSE
jgi:pyridoxal phosphate phosphatase PHOSPHO2